MIRSRILVAVLAGVCVSTWSPNEAAAQRLYSGSTPGDAQYSGGSSLDSNGRARNAEGRAVDRYGHVIDDYGRPSAVYVPGNAAMVPNGTYYPGGYSGLGYSRGIGYSVGVGGYSGGYSSNAGRFGSSVSTGTTYLAPPRTIVVGGVYNNRTVMNNQTRGGVVEYTNNGNGYIYSPGTSYQTVLSTGPSIFPSISVVQPSQPPALIETRPTQTIANSFPGNLQSRSSVSRPADSSGSIKLIFPKESVVPISYVLNGTVYTIKPGYTQTFLDDRIWTIEFLRGGSGSLPMRYELNAGTYQFVADENGWDLKPLSVAAVPGLPPAASPASVTTPLPLAPPTEFKAAPLVPAPVPSPDL